VQKKKRAKGRGNATGELRELLAANRRGKGVGIYSICSANRFVLEAAMLQAERDQSLLLIESTSNQVNQFGGYTGQTPAEFVKFVDAVAAAAGFPRKKIILGGDHLGPHVWRNTAASAAMEKAGEMVAAYVSAGYGKIHLDASMPCADDRVDGKGSLRNEIVAARAAELCRVAEQAHGALSASAPAPLYVIGTEVPVPGGEVAGSKAPAATKANDLRHTLHTVQKAFFSRGLESAWERVIAVVVQPGVEFGDATVFPYDAKKAQALSRFLVPAWSGVYEAHSTDYQTPCALRQMVLDHFAILKVGPWLTFAFREAVFALAEIEKEWLSDRTSVSLSGLPEVVETAMLRNPTHWKSYYHGEEKDLRIARKFSYSDRVRYYWPEPTVAAALQRLAHNLSAYPAPLSLLSQYLPRQANALRNGMLKNQPSELIHDKISEVLDGYAYAVGCARGKPTVDSRHLC
jgi:D-tagatose-1,6-bisphosphate aldolase subunit GatZ/KbaZ